MKNTVWNSNYFFGKEVSDYGKQNGFIDFHTLASAFDCVLCNKISSVYAEEIFDHVENGSLFDDSEIEECKEDIEDLEKEVAELREEIEDLEKDLENKNDYPYVYEDRDSAEYDLDRIGDAIDALRDCWIETSFCDEIDELSIKCDDIEEIMNIFKELDEKREELDEKLEELRDKRNELDELEENPNPTEVFQWFIISDNGAEILTDYTNELVCYIPTLDVYVWGVTHYGTSWDYVLTDIKIELPTEENENDTNE